MPLVSVVMPVFNVAAFVAQAVESVLAQSFKDFELIVVDDCSPDNSIAIVEAFNDPRIRIVRHTKNRGLAGARNSGIRTAKGEYIAFLDSDDTWAPEKLALHMAHFERCPKVGVSFSRSVFMAADGRILPLHQMPRLKDIDPGYFLRRNPVGNGSAPVLRRQVLSGIEEWSRRHGPAEIEYFDEGFRQSEDIECWIRIALKTNWVIEGIPEPLTRYRLNAGGLSAALYKQLASWEQMAEKLKSYAPEFARKELPAARAYQLRYLARQAIRLEDGPEALKLSLKALGHHLGLLREEPGRTVVTFAAAVAMCALPIRLYRHLERVGQAYLGAWQSRKIDEESALQSH